MLNEATSQTNQLWSMAQIGGPYGSGTIFKMNLDGSGDTVVYNFDNIDGAYPEGSLIHATNGLLYGMAEEGGTNGQGAIFSFDPVSYTYTDIFNFNDSISGEFPWGSLFQAANGKLYGVTNQGGSNGYGVIFNYNIHQIVLQNY